MKQGLLFLGNHQAREMLRVVNEVAREYESLIAERV